MSEKFDDNLLNEVNLAIKKLHETQDKYGVESAEYKRVMENTQAKLNEFDDKNEELVAKIAEQEKSEKELKERVEHLEQLGSMRSQEAKQLDPHAVANSIFTKSWTRFAEKSPNEAQRFLDETELLLKSQGNDIPSEIGSFQNAVMQMKAANDLYRTDINEAGGFLVPQEWSARLREQIIEYSPMRQFANVETITGKSINMPIEQGVGTAQWEGEAEENTDNSTANYTNELLTPHRLAKTVPITWDMLNNSAYNVSQRIMNVARKAFAQAEGSAFVSGNGVKKPLGFVADPNVPLYTTAGATITFDDIIAMTGELKTGYNPRFFFNRRTLAYLRTLKDAVNGRYLWAGPFGDSAAGSPATINGVPYSSAFIDMDDVTAANGNAILLADMAEFYVITDRTDMVVIRDEVTQKKKATVEFEVMKWTHGQPVLKEAGILMKRNG